jgi:hypothetical protein
MFSSGFDGFSGVTVQFYVSKVNFANGRRGAFFFYANASMHVHLSSALERQADPGA